MIYRRTFAFGSVALLAGLAALVAGLLMSAPSKASIIGDVVIMIEPGEAFAAFDLNIPEFFAEDEARITPASKPVADLRATARRHVAINRAAPKKGGGGRPPYLISG